MIENKLFYVEETDELPLTYQKLKLQKTEEIKELKINATYTNSKQHYSASYIVYAPTKPFSNIIL